ncbi:MAG: hypothetical protein IPO69_02870 [Saprospiraceae bacterium]|nr:hypothetical protein [Saprospiraceae bacterium]
MITGGYEYTGTQVPSLEDKFLFGDIPKGRLFYVNTSDISLGQIAPIKEWQVSVDGKLKTLKELCGNDRGGSISEKMRLVKSISSRETRRKSVQTHRLKETRWKIYHHFLILIIVIALRPDHAFQYGPSGKRMSSSTVALLPQSSLLSGKKHGSFSYSCFAGYSLGWFDFRWFWDLLIQATKKVIPGLSKDNFIKDSYQYYQKPDPGHGKNKKSMATKVRLLPSMEPIARCGYSSRMLQKLSSGFCQRK